MGGGSRRRAAQIAGLVALLSLAVASAALASGATGRAGVRAQRLDTAVHHATLDLYVLDTRLHAARTRLSALEAASAQLHRECGALRQELTADRATLEAARRDLAQRLRTLYEQGTVDPVAVVLGASSLSTALQRLDDLKLAADESHRVVAVTTAARQRLLRTRLRLSTEARGLARSLVGARAAERSLANAAATRLSYVVSLRTQLQAAQVGSVVATARTAQTRTQRLQRRRHIAPSPIPSGRRMVVSATAYSLPGYTASGLPVGWGVVAVDPTVIPLGTKMYVPGYGDAVAADVGSGVRGAMIDLWFPTLAQAQHWGRRTVTITLY
jgi:3D (Asp-Asp-Asp) domain-containing protein/peptidoglycan hydrolase CwlO-like protein